MLGLVDREDWLPGLEVDPVRLVAPAADVAAESAKRGLPLRGGSKPRITPGAAPRPAIREPSKDSAQRLVERRDESIGEPREMRLDRKAAPPALPIADRSVTRCRAAKNEGEKTCHNKNCGATAAPAACAILCAPAAPWPTRGLL